MEIVAPGSWRYVDFISDLHLQASERLTFAAWADYMRATRADAVFILGDLFEVWVGDDVLTHPTGFEAQCAAVVRHTAARAAVYIMQGNRDFLMGSALMQSCTSTLLADPSVLTFGGQRWLLTHGDALCLDDLAYQAFRTTVRSATWQRDFLAKSLSERQAIARGIRDQSEARKRDEQTYADIDPAAAAQWLKTADCATLIHGHTHQPADHPLPHGAKRFVLSDWDVSATPPRAQVLRLTRDAAGQAQVLRLSARAAVSA